MPATVMIGGLPQDELIKWAEKHFSSPTHDINNAECPFCKSPFSWTESKVSLVNFNLNALKIAAGVFAQINKTQATAHGGKSYDFSAPRTLSDFRESVDAVFKAAGLEKVEWE